MMALRWGVVVDVIVVVLGDLEKGEKGRQEEVVGSLGY